MMTFRQTQVEINNKLTQGDSASKTSTSKNSSAASQAIKGIEATLADLIKARPAKALTGFAPAGKVNTHQWGSYQSAYKGRGMEFAESRAYQPGDDVKYIDWLITARTGKTHTKLYQEERERPIQLLVDMRAMMQFGTRTRFKANMVAHIAAQLAWVGFDGGDRVGGQILTREGIADFRGARTRRAILRFLDGLSKQTKFHLPKVHPRSNDIDKPPIQSTEYTLAEGLYRLRKTSRPGSLVFVLSDLHDFDERASQELTRLSNHSHITLIQVNDPMDKALPAKAGRVSDGVSAIDLMALNDTQLQSYAQAFDARQQQIHKICMQHGITLHELLTTDDPAGILRQSGKRPKASNKAKQSGQDEHGGQQNASKLIQSQGTSSQSKSHKGEAPL